MSAAAIVMLVVALLLVWGGLVAALLHLRKHPEEFDVVEDGHQEYPPST
ncbi:methionine/alanine import family NSS transporter small subunit [Occultella gossypii]|uniref:Methionine/alanine import family NSS transporter small subunit n=1 Tax=Occultella gossypii TaxID=2800820 RepID=A0ABS7S7L2_9MICO|nr:methionine/alanine import family NSS transporter small subunit [Occultella gossypii]MBZ2196336.1 methionine/alanine import family NSS transporter small subunit [Occultella gossypii]